MEKLIVKGVDLSEFIGIRYEISRHPGNTSVDEFLADTSGGANCQLFTLGVERKAGFYIDDQLSMEPDGRFGSRELWLDTKYTKCVIGGWYRRPNILWDLFCEGELSVFDIYFFLPPGINFSGENVYTDDDLFKKFHTAVFIGFDFGGSGLVSNLRRAFLHNAKPGPSATWSLEDFKESGYTLFGVKRPICRAT